ncbi:thermonuclease-like protein [Rubidibacter lacunae KORDI 51-2]|uniref:Thermonuclease-like protein n=1 Tax=Rubidibacter lacunae KORDI 51-2 TaxID=582515 RepID=U5DKA1_9CHRO|nr:thermonuclease family protein [Rubidibacter lacunae]ERN41347.1 thermonuclease-like protein [Rubidibacter lacunae KORDI 51-2]
MIKRWFQVACFGAIAAALFLHREPVEFEIPGSEPRAIAVSPAARSREVWQVKPGSVYDGDTLRVTNGPQELKIRFCGIDAPEKDQPFGVASRDYLRSLLPDGAEVAIAQIELDRYERTVAEVFLGDESVNAQMVRAGLAWHYERYSGNCPSRAEIVQAEAEARSQGLGVFAAGNVPPWEWRRR